MTVPRHVQAAAIIRARIADGTLQPGKPAPSGAALARTAGCATLTARKALRALIEDGTLTPGPSPNARPRVPGPGPGSQTPDKQGLARARRELSAALAARRRAAGHTQHELAALAGCSVTSIGHAETGRLWQSRRFWEQADNALHAGGELLRRHDGYRAAAAPHPASTRQEPAVIIALHTPLEDADPIILDLLKLATETMLAHPPAVPPSLFAMLDTYAADLTEARATA
jgi:transcriptional regulator with XRE-family HTH domain